MADDTTEAVSLPNFFALVTTAFVEAQKKLDLESQKYNQGLAPELRDPNHDVSFRIPSLRATFSFQIDELTEKGVNVVFYKQSSQTQSTTKQEIELTIEPTAVLKAAGAPSAPPTDGARGAPKGQALRAPERGSALHFPPDRLAFPSDGSRSDRRRPKR